MSTAKSPSLWSGPLAQCRPFVLSQFEENVEFYQIFLRLINKSCP